MIAELDSFQQNKMRLKHLGNELRNYAGLP